MADFNQLKNDHQATETLRVSAIQGACARERMSWYAPVRLLNSVIMWHSRLQPPNSRAAARRENLLSICLLVLKLGNVRETKLR